MRRGRNSHDAEDIVHEAWIRMTAYEKDRPVEKPEAFLMRSALNLSVDMHRSSQCEGEAVALVEASVAIDTAPGPEQTVFARERMARLELCMSRLDDLTREVFLAARLEGKTYQQIGDQFGISPRAVGVHVGKAVLHVATWMRGW